MASIVRNVVHWGSHSQRQKSQVQVDRDLCEVFRLTSIFNVDVDFCTKICGKKPKFVDKGFKHPYCSRSCARNGQGPSPTACVYRGCRATGKPAFANFCSEAHARYNTSIPIIHSQIKNFLRREGVLHGQAEGCELCGMQPRIVGTMCITCDRLVCTGPQLKELNTDGTIFKNRKFLLLYTSLY